MGILDIMIDELNKEQEAAGEPERFKRMCSQPGKYDEKGNLHAVDGKFIKK